MVAAAGGLPEEHHLHSGTLTPYLPRIVLRQMALAPGTGVQSLPGSLLFADVSGFTRLSERLARMGREGAEHISEAIGTSFASLLEVAYANGGGLLKFGGDALLLFFEGEGHAERACRSAIGMRQALRRVGRVETAGVRITLRISIGVHSDTLHLFAAGRSHREPIITGPAASIALQMEQTAGVGEIVVSPASCAQLPAGTLGPAAGPGRLLRAAPRGPDAAPEEAPWTLDERRAAAALPVAVRRHIQDGGQAPEHRLVTIAFVRFGGTDELIARDGPEAAAVVLDDLVAHVQRAADEHEVAFLGSDVDVDGGKLLLCAGAPRAVGDDEARVLLALREIVEHPHGLPVRIGVNRGRVFTGDVGPAYRRTYTAMGDAVNLAARLMGKARPGEIYATAGVLERSSTRFALTELPPLEMKGKARPVQAWAVGPALKRSRADGGAEHDGALVGRDEELTRLRDALASARGGAGRLVELSGDPGVGKTRLVEALRDEAVGITLLRATCEAHSAAAPYAAWRELLLDLIGAHFDSPPATVLSRLETAVQAHDPALEPWLPLLAAALGVELPDTPPVAQLSAEFRSARVHEAVLDLLRACLPEPAVLEIDQAHHMDAASGELLGALLETLPSRPWLVVTTRRATPGGFTAPDAAHVEQLPLGPLAPADARRLAERLTEHQPLPPHVVALAAERSAGNPQFLHDLLADAASGGGELPETIEAAATARIDRLAPQDRALVRRASVLGMSFRPRMLADVLDGELAPGEELLRRLDDVFADDGDGWIRFRIGVVRDAAYGGLPFRLRRRLHAIAGAQLERGLGSAAGEQGATLSLHFLLAGDHRRAWRYAREGAERAGERGAYADAVLLYRRALDAAHGAGVDVRDVAEAWIAVGEAHARTGEPQHAQDAFRRARRLLKHDAVGEADVLRRQTELADRAGDAARAVRCGMRGLRTLDGVNSRAASRCRARLLAALATARMRQGRCEGAISLCAQAIAEGEAADDDRAVAHACFVLDWALHDAGRAAEAQHSARALAIYEALGDLDRQAGVLNNLGAYAFHSGSWADAVVLYRRAGNLCTQAGDVVNAAFADCNVGEVLVLQGRLTAADEVLRRAVRVWRGTGDDSGVAFANALLGRAAVHQGRSEAGRGLIAGALAKFQSIGHQADAQVAEALLAEALVFGGHAERTLQTIEALRVRLLDERLEPLLERLRGCALAQLGELPAARTALTLGLDRARELQTVYDEAAGLDALDAFDVAMGEIEPARRRERNALLERLGVVRLPAAPLKRQPRAT